MVDIQSATAENRQGEKEERRNIETTAAIYNVLPYWVAIKTTNNVGCPKYEGL